VFYCGDLCREYDLLSALRRISKDSSSGLKTKSDCFGTRARLIARLIRVPFLTQQLRTNRGNFPFVVRIDGPNLAPLCLCGAVLSI
jgi:hypothetical protein